MVSIAASETPDVLVYSISTYRPLEWSEPAICKRVYVGRMRIEENGEGHCNNFRLALWVVWETRRSNELSYWGEIGSQWMGQLSNEWISSCPDHDIEIDKMQTYKLFQAEMN